MKDFFKFLASKVFWINVLTAIIVALVLVIITLFGLKLYTEHGKEYKVPDLAGLTIEEVNALFSTQKLSYEIIDSVYQKKAKPGVVVEQNPSGNSMVKAGRKIYLTINARSKQLIPVPDVSDISVRQATAMLQSMGLIVQKTEYVPSKYKDLVQEVRRFNGETLLPGTRIPIDSKIILIVGSGANYQKERVPDLRGMSLTDAAIAAAQSDYKIGDIHYDIEPENSSEESLYYVYEQSPLPESLSEGSSFISLWLSKPELAE